MGRHAGQIPIAFLPSTLILLAVPSGSTKGVVLKIARIEVENVFGFQSFALDLGDLSALVGPNNGGKTSLLRVVKLGTDILALIGGMTHPSQKAQVMNGDLGIEPLLLQFGIHDGSTIFFQNSPTGSITLTLTLGNEKRKIRFALSRPCKFTLGNRGNAQEQGNQIDETFWLLADEFAKGKAEYLQPINQIQATESVLPWESVRSEIQQGRFANTWRNWIHWRFDGVPVDVFPRVMRRLKEFLPTVQLQPPRRSLESNTTVDLGFTEKRGRGACRETSLQGVGKPAAGRFGA